MFHSTWKSFGIQDTMRTGRMGYLMAFCGLCKACMGRRMG